MSGAPLVIVCTCHGTLSRTLSKDDLEAGVGLRRPQPRLEFVPSLCRREDAERLAALIEHNRPTAVLLAACSPFAKGMVALKELNRRCSSTPMDLVDLREGCAWIHSGNPEAATVKAVDLVRMTLAGLEHHVRNPRPRARAEQHILVVGAGPAGLAAAGTLARLGVAVTLADRMERAGGLLNQIGRIFPHNTPGQDFLAPLLLDTANPAVNFLPKTVVTRIDGDPGRFEAHLRRGGEETAVVAGAVILACGAMPVLPEGRFRSSDLSGVISQLELETRLKKLETQEEGTPEFQSAVFIQCVAARDDARPYCSTVCCPTALKNGLRLKHLNKDIQVTVLHRGVMAPGHAMEELYRRAMAAGIRFVAYSPDFPPQVRGNGKAASVALTDALSGKDAVIPADLVVLSTPLKPRPETATLAESLGVRLDTMGFACGSEPMQPLLAPVPGVYLCGTVRWPVYAEQAVDQGRAAAIKAAGFLIKGEIDSDALLLPGPSPGMAAIRPEACSRCGQCVAVCPYLACRRIGDGSISVSAVRCRGCGLCTSVCPSGAARIPERSEAVRAMLREIAPRIVP
jgi:heterodisulfide reductase subunit A2